MKLSLLKISFMISLLGIFILLMLLNFTEPELTNISNLTIKDLNKKVKVHGKIINQQTYNENFQILIFSDETGKIEILIDKKITFSKNNITVIGRITQYKNKLQIQAEKIIQSTSHFPE